MYKIIPERRSPRDWFGYIQHRDRLYGGVSKSPDNDLLRLTFIRYRTYCKNLLRKLKRVYQ